MGGRAPRPGTSPRALAPGWQPAERRVEKLSPVRRRVWLALPLCATAMAPLGASAPGAVAASPPASGSASVLLAFLPSRGVVPSATVASPSPGPGSGDGATEAELATVKGLSVGIMSAAQGSYTTVQLLLDITQGARIASSAYADARPLALSLKAAGTGAAVRGWSAARKRAEDAPA